MASNNQASATSSNAVSSTVILSTLQNIVTAINNWATTTLDIAGNQSFNGLTSATVVAQGSGRMAVLSVVVGGSGAGKIYDATTTSDVSRPICIIPTTAGTTTVNIRYSFGLVIAPGSGQTVSGGFS